MSYLIAILSDRIKAEAAYTALEESNVPQSQMSIIGRGYKTADEFGLQDPGVVAKNRAILMAYWLVPFGFVGGYVFNLITGLDTFDWVGEPGNHILGGILGAIGGVMGSVFIGGGVSLSSNNDDALPYRDSLDEGKYLIAVKGSELIQQKAATILRRFNPENLKGYN